MSFLARFLMNVFTQLATSLGLLVGKKVAVAGAAAAVMLSLLLAFYASTKLLVSGIMHQVTNEYILMAFYLLWPSNAELCISTYWSFRISLFLYREWRENVRMAAYIT